MGELPLQMKSDAPARPAATATQEAEELFMRGPPMLVESKLGLVRPGRLNTARRCVLFIVITWMPLCVLTAMEGTFMPGSHGISFLVDMGAISRSWVAGPLLLLADVVAGRELSRVAARFAWMCEQSPSARAGFVRAAESTVRLRDGPLLEFAIAATVLLLVVSLLQGLPFEQLPYWQHSQSHPQSLSAAGWWYVVVSLPLLLVLVVGWLWRLVVWTSFLVQVARLELPIVPEHPDAAGGLGFIGYTVRGFTFVAAALGAIVAGAVANQVVHNGVPFLSMRYVIGGTVAACVVLFCAPMCVLAPRLAAERRAGMKQFGQLATSFGLQFRSEWFTGRTVDRETLDRGDFSAATDLYQVVDRVKAMRFLPIDRVNVAMLAVATLAPFAPVALMAMPFETLLKLVVGVLV
jgi:hypothetical protein